MLATDFWKSADALRLDTEHEADKRFAALRSAPVEVLHRVWSHYRFFTKRYISDLALLVSRVAPGSFRSMLGDILAEELGHGDYERDHLRLYDRFLASSDAPPALRELESDATRAILDDLSERVQRRSVAYGIGLRDMGGECNVLEAAPGRGRRPPRRDELVGPSLA